MSSSSTFLRATIALLALPSALAAQAVPDTLAARPIALRDGVAQRDGTGGERIGDSLRGERGGQGEQRDGGAQERRRGRHHLWQADLMRLRSASRRTSSSLRRASRRVRCSGVRMAFIWDRRVALIESYAGCSGE